MTDKYAPTAWAKKAEGQPIDGTFDYVTPNGQTCLVRKLIFEDIIELNLVDDLDSFSPAMLADSPSLKGKKKKAPKSEADYYKMMLSKDGAGMINVVNKVVAKGVVQPKLYMPPEVDPKKPDEVPARDEGKIYVDRLDFVDRIALFGEIFQGLGDMSQFLGGQAAVVEPVPNVAGDEQDPSGTGGDN